MTSHLSSLKLNHTCLRVKDPKKSVAFYEKNFGMSLVDSVNFPEKKFSLYFLTFNYASSVGFGKSIGHKKGLLELTHNWGTEDDADFKYNNGNEEPYRGFGHICFTVDNIDAVCKTLDLNGAQFKKRLTDGRQKDIAFVLDPDGYWVELLEIKNQDGAKKYKSNDSTNKETYKFNHTMVRVKDPVKSLKFYQEVVGMSLVNKIEFTEAKFTLYFLAFANDQKESENLHFTERSALLELTHNWGTENDANFQYHNGNDSPSGYGHIGLTVDDAAAYCEGIEKSHPEVEWSLKYNKGYLKNIAFFKDPDNYWIEVFPSNFDVHSCCPACSGELK